MKSHGIFLRSLVWVSDNMPEPMLNPLNANGKRAFCEGCESFETDSLLKNQTETTASWREEIDELVKF